MNASRESELLAELETVVRSTPGVTALFHAGRLLTKVIEASAQLVGTSAPDPALVRWAPSCDGPRVEVTIGVRESAGAAATSARVHAAIDRHCAERGLRPAEIHITVVHIDTAPTHGAARAASPRITDRAAMPE